MRSMHKRLGVIAGFLIVLVLLAINAAVLRHQLAVQVGNQESPAIRKHTARGYA
jgi:hypothetical protein